MKTIFTLLFVILLGAASAEERVYRIVATSSAREAILGYHGFSSAPNLNKAWTPLYTNANWRHCSHATLRTNISPTSRDIYQFTFVGGAAASKIMAQQILITWLGRDQVGATTLSSQSTESGVANYAFTDIPPYLSSLHPGIPISNFWRNDMVGVVHYRLLANHGSTLTRINNNHLLAAFGATGGVPKSMVTSDPTDGDSIIIGTGDAFLGSARLVLFSECGMGATSITAHFNLNLSGNTVSSFAPWPATIEWGLNVGVGSSGFGDPILLARSLRYSSAQSSIPVYNHMGPVTVIAAVPTEAANLATGASSIGGNVGAGDAVRLNFLTDSPATSGVQLAEKVKRGEYPFWSYLQFGTADPSDWYSQLTLANFRNYAVSGIKLTQMKVERHYGTIGTQVVPIVNP
jgi:hypothetical protein